MNNKLKLLTAFSMISLCANVYAHSGHGYRILSEEMVSTSGNFTVIDTTGNKKGTSYKQLKADSKHVTAIINQPVAVNGYHSITIKNIDTKKHKQTYKYQIDCLGEQDFFMRTIEIEGGGNFYDEATTKIVVKSSNVGVFPIRVMTSLSGGESGTTMGSARLTITK